MEAGEHPARPHAPRRHRPLARHRQRIRPRSGLLHPPARDVPVRRSDLVPDVPRPGQGARRPTALRRRSRLGDWYRSTWPDRKTKTQFENLADVVRKLNPKQIGILTCPIWYFGDALTAGLKDKLTAALGPEYSKRLVSADRLCVGWLETRSPQELSVYRHVCGSPTASAEFFSNAVIAPDVTPPRTSSGGSASASATWGSTPGSTPRSTSAAPAEASPAPQIRGGATSSAGATCSTATSASGTSASTPTCSGRPTS